MPYLFAVGSSLVFAISSVYYTEYARRFSPVWMNTIKATVLFSSLVLTTFLFESWVPLSTPVIIALVVSGLLGLAIGDIFLLSAYARIGAARTLILFGFQPLFIGIAARFLFQQDLNPERLLAIFFFIGCLYTFSLERYRTEGHWEIWGLVAALIGVIFDNAGVILTRWSFEAQPDLGVLQANLFRAGGAVAFFVLFGFIKNMKTTEKFLSLSPYEMGRVTLVSFCGTFVSLFLYLTAIREGHLASIAAVGVSGPLFASFFECIKERKKPSLYLLIALVFFLAGAGVLILLID